MRGSRTVSITIKPRGEILLPISLRNITPDQLEKKTATEISRLPVRAGNESVELGELYSVAGSDSGVLEFDGDFSMARFLGAEMRSGTIRVTGDGGSDVGSQMLGGSIDVVGNVGDFPGAEMLGGSIVVRGNAGGFAGGAYPGSKTGMNRGTILIRGNAGRAAGFRMRRGVLAIEGDAGEFLGWQMRAGTIVCFGAAAPVPGFEMLRGTIVLASSGIEAFDWPTFSKSFRGTPEVIGLLKNELRQMEVEPEKVAMLGQEFQTMVGDHLMGGRGELFGRVTV